jgi:hypothetical protein
LYTVSAISANLSRELLITSLTLGASAAAQGGRVGFVASRLADHPRVLCAVTTASRAYQPVAAYYHVTGTVQAATATMDSIRQGDYAMAGLHMVDAGLNAMGASAALRESARMGRAVVRSANSGRIAPLSEYLTNCFAAGTPIQGEHGARPIEEFRPGDKVWARDENDPNAPPVLKAIEECFVAECTIWHLHVGGQVIRTTDEHPFWVDGQGWTAARDLVAGDRILGRDGETATVEEVFATGVWETVYNFRVAEYHTYFIGGEHWGFALWAHNQCFRPMPRRGDNWNPRTTPQNQRVGLYGAAQNTTGTVTDPHAARMLAKVDELSLRLEDGSYMVLNRSVRTGLGGLEVPGAPGGNLRPDIFVMQRVGTGRNPRWRVSMYEVQSPGQDPADLNAKLLVMKAALPPNVIFGEFLAILM